MLFAYQSDLKVLQDKGNKACRMITLPGIVICIPMAAFSFTGVICRQGRVWRKFHNLNTGCGAKGWIYTRKLVFYGDADEKSGHGTGAEQDAWDGASPDPFQLTSGH
jgi:hypothetical protein